jgi:peptide/nickel transport system substrate-binding protein
MSLQPASASIHEEASIATVMPFMGVFNNLFVFNQHAGRNDVTTSRPSWRRRGAGTRTAPA